MIIVLIEPKWNVKFDFIGAKDGKVIVLIEPKWNVKYIPSRFLIFFTPY